MSELLVAGLSATWLGILSSISPCPLATNVVAVSYTARRVERPWEVFATGLAYSTGRALAYLALKPMLILVGLLLLNIRTVLDFGGGVFAQRLGERFGPQGIAGAAFLGAVFAISFCPVPAAVYSGSLIPPAVASGSQVVVPSLYGIGTALLALEFSCCWPLGSKPLVLCSSIYAEMHSTSGESPPLCPWPFGSTTH